MGVVALIVAIAVITGAAGKWLLKPETTAVPRIVRATVNLPSGFELPGVVVPQIAISRDGKRLAYPVRGTGIQRLYLRDIDNFEGRPVDGTDGASSPFFSPDGRWVGFFAQGKVKKVSVNGGAPQTLADAPGPGRGGSWAEDDWIYFAPTASSTLWKVHANSAAPVAEEVTKFDPDQGDLSHRWPQILPGGKALLFTIWMGPGWGERHVVVQNLDTAKRRVIIRGGGNGRYVSSGHIIYTNTGKLMGVPFDLNGLNVFGNPAALGEFVYERNQGAHFAVSDSGTLAYVTGSPQLYERRLVWVDRSGKVVALPVPVADYLDPDISPEGRFIAVQILGQTHTISIFDLVRGTLTPLATPAGSSNPGRWTLDGKKIIYRATRAGTRNLFWKAWDGSGEEERLTSGNPQTPSSVSSDGKLIALTEDNVATGLDIWLLRLDGKSKP